MIYFKQNKLLKYYNFCSFATFLNLIKKILNKEDDTDSNKARRPCCRI